MSNGKLYIVRHGQTDANKAGVVRAQYDDYGINETGRKQALEVSEKFHHLNFDKVFSSPLRRALETCKIIRDGDIETDVRLIERNFGELVGLRYKPYDKAEFDLASLYDYNQQKYPTVESLTDMESRAFAFIKDVKENFTGKNVLAISHGDIMTMFNVYLHGRPKNTKHGEAIYPSNCGIIEIEI